MRADYFCPDCERLIVTQTPRRLKDRYYCPSCDKLVDAKDLIRRSFKSATILGGAGRGAPSFGFEVLGEVSVDAGAADLSITDISAQPEDSLFVVAVGIGDDEIPIAEISSATWGATALTNASQASMEPDFAAGVMYINQVTAANSATVTTTWDTVPDHRYMLVFKCTGIEFEYFTYTSDEIVYPNYVIGPFPTSYPILIQCICEDVAVGAGEVTWSGAVNLYRGGTGLVSVTVAKGAGSQITALSGPGAKVCGMMGAFEYL